MNKKFELLATCHVENDMFEREWNLFQNLETNQFVLVCDDSQDGNSEQIISDRETGIDLCFSDLRDEKPRLFDGVLIAKEWIK